MKLGRLRVLKNFGLGAMCPNLSALSTCRRHRQPQPSPVMNRQRRSEMVRTRIGRLLMLIVSLIGLGLTAGSISAQRGDQHSVNKLAIAESTVQQLLLLMDANKNGKITKQDFMRFMEAEFDRLDKNKLSELDVKELAQSQLRVSSFASVGK